MAKKATYKVFNGTAFEDIYFKTSIEQVEGLQDALSNIPNASNVVQLTGDQTINGNKSFNRPVTIKFSESSNPGIQVEGQRASARYTNIGATGGVAAAVLDGRIRNTSGNESRVMNIGMYGAANLGGNPTSTYMYLDSMTDGAWNNTTLKVDSQNRIGIAIASSGRPTQALDVNGKIRMRTATVSGDADDIVTTKGYVDNNLNTKVDKVEGKGLSTNDFTTTEKNKLSGIAAGAQVNVGTNLSQGARNTTTLRIDSSTGSNLTLPAVTTSLAGLMSATDKQRLNVLHSLLEEDTSNNVVDSITEVLEIFNNYPEGADLVTTLAGKVDKVTGKQLSTNDYTTTEKNKLAGIAAGAEKNVGTNLDISKTNTTNAISSSTGISTAIITGATTTQAGLMTSADKTKLDGIDTGAQVNRSIASQDDAETGTNNTRVMTPLRVKEAITANLGGTTIALGQNSTASGINSIALGRNAAASEVQSMALGLSAVAEGSSSMALGSDTSASGPSSIALGYGASAGGISSIAIGTGTIVTDDHVADFGSNRQVRVNETPVNNRDAASKKYVDDAVANITPSGTWKEVYSGPSGLLSKTSFSTLTLNESATYFNRPMMMEIKYGSSTTDYTNQIVTFNLGSSSSTLASKSYPRTVSITDFDGRYFKTISVNTYAPTTGATNSLRVGYVKTLIGNFTGSSGTLTWTTESSDNISVYIGKIWVLE